MAARSQPASRLRRIPNVHGETQRDADHVAEIRPVAMPADGGARPIFGDQHMLQAIGRQSGERGGALAHGKNERRDRRGLLQAAAVEVVAQAE